MSKSLRYKIFYALLMPFSKRVRQRRMALFVTIMKPTPEMRILDLGGRSSIWDSVQVPLNITCVNLPGVTADDSPSHHFITYVEGDACDMPNFQPGDFDLVFSNSVIEHVGDAQKRRQFATEVQRLCDRFWIQTPSRYFPIEAHCGMPFWWFYPPFLRSYFLNQWAVKLPAWTDMVATTDVVGRPELRRILPGCQTHCERFLGIPKSLIAYSVGSSSPRSVTRSEMVEMR